MLTVDEVLSDFALYAGYGEAVVVSVSSRTTEGETPLHWMAVLGDPAGIGLLRAAGADVNACASSGNTPVHEAILHRQVSAVKALIDAGADLTIRNQAGLTPLDCALRDGFRPIVDLLTSS